MPEIEIIEEPNPIVITVEVPGPPGSPNILTIGDITTLDYTEEASAEITGFSPNQVLSLSIPRGEPGTSGDHHLLTNLDTFDDHPQYFNQTRGDARYSLTTHNHDSRYYTETEVDTLLAGKSDTTHNHDTRYYTETETDTLLSGKADTTHTHLSTDISDSTAVGRSVLTAADAAAARTAIGAGTGNSNLALGTTSTTAAAGDHTHTDLTNATASATAGTLVKRDSNSRAQMADPSAAQDIATKAYSDKMANLQTANFQTGTTYTPVLADGQRQVDLSNASTISVTIPLNSAVAFPVGTVLKLVQFGAGQVNVAGDVGVTVNTPPGFTAATHGQSGTIYARKRDTDHWILSGHLLPATPSSASHLTRKDYVDGTTKTASQISDSTAVGRSVLTATDAAAARTAISAANATHTHASTDISDSTSIGRSILTAADAAAVRTLTGAPPATRAINAGTGLTGGGDLSADRTLSVSYGSTSGTAVQGNDTRVTADQAAGTASIRTLGTGSTQAAAGNHTHTSKEISNASVALTDGATINTDASLGRLFRVTVAGNRTFAAPTNASDGMRIVYEITASAADRTVTFTTGSSGAFAYGTDFTSIPTILSGTTTFVGAVYSSRSSRWHLLAVGGGHS